MEGKHLYIGNFFFFFSFSLMDNLLSKWKINNSHGFNLGTPITSVSKFRYSP